MSVIHSVVNMSDVVITHAHTDFYEDVQDFRKDLTQVFNKKIGFCPEKGDELTTSEWRMYDAFVKWLTESWESSQKEFYPSNGAFLVMNRKTGQTCVFVVDVGARNDPSISGFHTR